MLKCTVNCTKDIHFSSFDFTDWFYLLPFTSLSSKITFYDIKIWECLRLHLERMIQLTTNV